MAPGLRERRKQKTRQAISDIATRMFVERGFAEVTIAQVADAAGVAKMTVTNYFPRKEDLVFDRAEAVVRHLADVITARAPGESLLAAIRRDRNRQPATAARGGPALFGAPCAVRRSQPAQPGRAATRGNLCDAGRRLNPG